MARRAWKAVAVGGAVVGVIGIVLLANQRQTNAFSIPARVALIGDSYAVGLGPELAKLLPNFKYEGHVGTNTAQWANLSSACGQCGDWIATFRPAIVLVALGVNDGSSANVSNYQAIVQTLHGSGARVVWIEPPAGVSTPTVRNAIAALSVPVVPPTTTPLRSDGLHPQSYAPWAKEIAEAVTHG